MEIYGATIDNNYHPDVMKRLDEEIRLQMKGEIIVQEVSIYRQTHYVLKQIVEDKYSSFNYKCEHPLIKVDGHGEFKIQFFLK